MMMMGITAAIQKIMMLNSSGVANTRQCGVPSYMMVDGSAPVSLGLGYSEGFGGIESSRPLDSDLDPLSYDQVAATPGRQERISSMTILKTELAIDEYVGDA